MALEKGEIDLIFGKNMIDADAINQYTGNDNFTVALSDPTSTRQIVLNTTRDILDEKEVRKALQHATNKAAISEGIFYGLEQPADTLFASTVPYCDINLPHMSMMWKKQRRCWRKQAGRWLETAYVKKTARKWNWSCFITAIV